MNLTRNRYLGITALSGLLMLTAIATGGRADDTATLLPNAIQYFMDANGKPLANGKIYMYTPSTTTAKTTWTTASKTVAQANPIPLGISGKPANPIYGDGSYRQVVKDQFNNTIWDFNTASTGGSGGGGGGTTVGDGNIVGTVLSWTGLLAPPNYLFAFGQAIIRVDYPLLFSTTTIPTNAICTSGLNVISGIADTQNIRANSPVEASCLPPGTIVASVAANSVTVSANATVSTSVVATFFPYGNGNGSTTFNIPDLRGFTIVGRNNMGGTASTGLTAQYYGTSPNALGAPGGSQSTALVLQNLPPITPAGTITNGAITSTFTGTANQQALGPGGGAEGFAAGTLGHALPSGTIVSTQATSSFTGTLGGGTSVAFSQIQPSKTTNFIIKVLPDESTAVITGVGSLGGMTGVIACGVGLNCASQTISSTIGQGTDGYVLTGFGVGSPPAFAGFVQNGVNPAIRTPQNKMRDFVNLRDYGVEGDGITDDGPAIQRAINSLTLTGGKDRILRVSDGLTGRIFQIGAEIMGIDNLRVECTPGMTFVSNAVIRSYFRFDGKTNVVFDGCTFDGNQPNLPVYSDEPALATKNAGISMDSSSNLTVVNSTFTNLYTRAIALTNNTGKLTIRNSTFTSPTPNQAENYQHIDILTFDGSIEIANSRFVNTPVANKGYGVSNIFASGQRGNILIEGNYMDTCSRTNTITTHRLACIDFYYNAENLTIRNNEIKGINWEWMRVSNAWPGDIYGNVVRLNDDAAVGNVLSIEAFPFALAADKGIKHLNVYDNKFFGSATSNGFFAIACSVYDYAFPCTDVKVYDNSFTNFNTTFYVNGVFDGIQFYNNYSTGIYNSSVQVQGTTLTALYGVTEANSFAGRLHINDNIFVQTAVSTGLPINIDMTTGHTYTGTMGLYEISRNDFTTAGNVNSAISAIGGNSGPKGRLITQQNNAVGFTTGQTITNWSSFNDHTNQFNAATTRTNQTNVTTYNGIDLNNAKVAIVGTAGGTQYNFNLPTTAGSSGDCLKSGGGALVAMTWGGCISAVAGSDTQVQFNNAGAFGASANLTWVSPALTIGAAGSTTGQLKLTGATSGTATIAPQASAGTSNLVLPNASGTFAVSAASPLSLSATTGALSWVTTVNQLLYSSATNTVTGLPTTAGGLLITNSSGVPTMTANPTLGVAGSIAGSMAFSGVTSGIIQIQTNAAAGSAVLTLPNTAGTFAVNASAPLALNATTGNLTVTGAAGQVLAGATPAFTATPTLGVAGTTLGTLALTGNTSGTVTLTPQAAAGTAALTLPNTSGTLAAGASSPLALSATTGNLTCPTCVTSSGGGAISGTAPISVSAAGVVSITSPLPVANGGTALSSGTSGGILGYTASGTLASSVALTNHALVVGAGAGATPTPLASLGTTTTVLHGNASGDPTFGAVSLTTDATGTLQAAQMLALTGGCITSAGSVATSCSINTNLPMGNAGTCGTINPNQTVYVGPLGCFDTTESHIQTPVSAPFTLKNFYAAVAAAPGGAQTYVMTVRKNGVATTITCTMTGAATTCNDTTHTAAFVAGDLISTQMVLSATAVGTASMNSMSTAVTTTP